MTTDNLIFESVYARLETELSAHFTYHSKRHTEFVVKMAGFLAEKEACDEATRRLISFAALYHDTGFLIGAQDHEMKSCEIAREELSKFGLSTDEIEKICGMIMATRIPQNPVTLPEKIVADADLYYLGTDRYDIISKKLYEELRHFNENIDDAKWLEIQIKFLSQHHYHTPYAQEYLEPVKQIHFQKLL